MEINLIVATVLETFNLQLICLADTRTQIVFAIQMFIVVKHIAPAVHCNLWHFYCSAHIGLNRVLSKYFASYLFGVSSSLPLSLC